MKHLVCNVMAAIPVVFFSGWANGETQHTLVELETSSGTIVLELFDDKAPKTVANFITYVDSGYFKDTTFHRVIKGFMVQGGGLDENMAAKPTKPAVSNEADNGVKNLRGTVAMARTMEPHSATSQFFINTVDNSFLDFKAKTPQGWGYCVFGKVVKGMEIVDAIEKQPTTQRSGHGDVPVTPIKIIRAQKVNEASSSEK